MLVVRLTFGNRSEEEANDPADGLADEGDRGLEAVFTGWRPRRPALQTRSIDELSRSQHVLPDRQGRRG